MTYSQSPHGITSSSYTHNADLWGSVPTPGESLVRGSQSTILSNPHFLLLLCFSPALCLFRFLQTSETISRESRNTMGMLEKNREMGSLLEIRVDLHDQRPHLELTTLAICRQGHTLSSQAYVSCGSSHF